MLLIAPHHQTRWASTVVYKRFAVGTIHWRLPHEKEWPNPDLPCSHQDIPKLRAVCEEHGVEPVENRREVTEYTVANKLGIKSLLADGVRENAYASLMTNMNIARHFNSFGPPTK